MQYSDCTYTMYLLLMQCSANCGGGLRTRSVRCLNKDGIISPQDCDPENRPVSYEFCSQVDCGNPNGELILNMEISSIIIYTVETPEHGDIQHNHLQWKPKMHTLLGPSYRKCHLQKVSYDFGVEHNDVFVQDSA